MMLRREITRSVDRLGGVIWGPVYAFTMQRFAHDAISALPEGKLREAVRVLGEEAERLRKLLGGAP